ncbi:MAG: 2-dehydro-3-deoxyphosphogluconate aldolase/4-hydroxy-2-oxoglutarate aldolase [Firmicutes bacterium]|nr:2-dehydro-3-deoxyphosphogluconate aldolase/4-hydroxy-2-oxoglutarate aldolase [Bacillota bacterium]
MWKKVENLKAIYECGMIAIIRSDDAEDAYKIAEAAIAGGARALEIPFAVPDVLNIIKKLTNKYSSQGIVIGVGTVLDAENASAALIAGAEMLVSSSFSADMIRMANRYQAITVSGAMSPTEISDSLAAGADIIKLFPAEFYGHKYVKTLRAPMPTAPIVPFGGVTPENVGEWLEAGCVAVGVGSYISKAHKKDGDYGKVTQATKEFLEAIVKARQ